MGELATGYHEVIVWTTEEINSRLGELAINKGAMNKRKQAEVELEEDCLIFELGCRDGEWAI